MCIRDRDSRPFTADLPQVRAKAIELTKKSMEQGAALGAGYIVLHMGTVEPLVDVYKRQSPNRAN